MTHLFYNWRSAPLNPPHLFLSLHPHPTSPQKSVLKISMARKTLAHKHKETFIIAVFIIAKYANSQHVRQYNILKGILWINKFFKNLGQKITQERLVLHKSKWRVHECSGLLFSVLSSSLKYFMGFSLSLYQKQRTRFHLITLFSALEH